MLTRILSPGLLGVGLLGLALASAAPVRASTAAPTPSYTLTDLGTLPGGGNSYGSGVNVYGQVTGSSDTPSGGHAFLSGPNGGPLKDLGVLPGNPIDPSSEGAGVNASGQVAGSSPVANDQLRSSFYHAVLSSPNGGALTDLGTLPGDYSSIGRGVNDAGQVTGYSYPRVGPAHAFLSSLNGGALHDLGTLPGGTMSEGFSEGFGVNASGQVTGYSDTIISDGSNPRRAFLSSPNGGALRDLGALPGGSSTIGFGVNDSGQVVGNADTASGDVHAFLSGPNGGPLKDLGTLPDDPSDTNSEAFGVNNSGQVVGDVYLPGTSVRAFLYSGGVMIDLNSLVAPGSGSNLFMTTATAISNNGFITGNCIASDGNIHACLLTPITVNVGPKITVTASASGGATGTLARTVTTTNTGGAAADMLQIKSVTLNSAAPAPAPVSPSPVPTTPNNLSNNPGMNTQQNGFAFAPPLGTKTAILRVSGTYTDPNTGQVSPFKGTIRLTLP